ncbi:hypothetical protein D918_05725 [Trichuris suis]|nr:hypothetical protein D918_05725 [Trichuris suis]
MPHVQDKSFVRSDVSVYLFCEHQKRPVNIVNWSTNCAYFPYLLNLNKARDMVQLALGMQCHCLALIRHDSCNILSVALHWIYCMAVAPLNIATMQEANVYVLQL